METFVSLPQHIQVFMKFLLKMSALSEDVPIIKLPDQKNIDL